MRILFIPKISTGVDGAAKSTFLSSSSIIALILPQVLPLTKKSPFFNLPFVTSTVDTGPLPLSILDSKITPTAGPSKFACKSRRSD